MTPMDGNSLMEMIQSGAWDDVTCLLRQDPSLAFITDDSGMTALAWACRKKAVELAKLLIDSGALVNVRDENLWTPVHYAIRGRSDECLKLLLENNADPNAMTDYGWTPCHYAAEGINRYAVQLLVEFGANLELKDRKGRTPCDLATDPPDFVALMASLRSKTPISISGPSKRNVTESSRFEYTFHPERRQMTLDEFWEVIDRTHSDDVDEHYEGLEVALSNAHPGALVDFNHHLLALLKQAQTQDLLGAAYLINDDYSSDAFIYFRCWLVAQGREVYEAALQCPDSLEEVLDHEEDDLWLPVAEFEDLLHLANRLYRAKTGTDISTERYEDSLDDGVLSEGWDFQNADEMRKRYPRLFESCMH